MTNCQRCRATLADDALNCNACGATVDERASNPFAVGVNGVANDELDFPAPSFKTASTIVLRKMHRLRGRASRAEFWYWILNCLVFDLVCLSFPVAYVIHWYFYGERPFDVLPNIDRFMWFVFGALTAMILVPLTPTFSVAVRRFHDCDRSGRLVALATTLNFLVAASLLYLICPLTSATELDSYGLMILYLVHATAAGIVCVAPFNLWIIKELTKRGTTGNNKYGPDPKEETL